MSATSPCIPCCTTPQSVNVPGPEGDAGTNGTNGVNAYTLTTADFVVPAIGATVTISVQSSAWMVVGQVLIVTGPANFLITVIPNGTSVTAMFLGYPGDVAPAATISSGAKVSPSGLRGGGTVYVTSTPASLGATAFMDVILVTATLQTITLPTAVGIKGKVYTVKLTAAGTGVVAATGGQTFDGAASYSLSAQWKFVSVVSDNANWLIIGAN